MLPAMSSSGAQRLPIDQARLRPHLRAGQRQADGPATSDAAETTSPRSWKLPTGDDLERLRGLPAVAPGVRGVVKGTDPLGELLAKERRRR
jgi:hypothetical protein